MKKFFIIILSLLLLNCEKRSECLKCHEVYTIQIWGIHTAYWDTTYIECYDNIVLEYQYRERTYDTKGLILSPLGILWKTKTCTYYFN